MKPYERRLVARSAESFRLCKGTRLKRKLLSNRSCLTHLTELEYRNRLCALKPARTALQHGRTMGASESNGSVSPHSGAPACWYTKLSFLSQGGSLMKKSVIVISGVLMGAFLMAPLSSFAGGTVTGKVTYSGKSEQKEFL